MEIIIKVAVRGDIFTERLLGITPSLAAVKRYCNRMGYELISVKFDAKINPTLIK